MSGIWKIPQRYVRGNYKKFLFFFLTLILMLGNVYQPASGVYVPGIPPAVDPGTPVFSGLANPVPAEPVPYDPATSKLQAIYDADMAAGGTSFWIDRVLELPGSTGGSYLYTRGRALYMYSHSTGTLGFARGYAYRERPTGSNQNMYTITVSDATLAETTESRRQYPSHWSSVHTATGLSIAQKKFITYNNVAVTVLTITNTSASSTTRTLTVDSPIATVASVDGLELTGTVNARYNLTVLYPRLSGDGFTVSGTSLTRSVTIPAGESITVKVQMGVITNEIPESASDYQRFRGYDPETAFLTQLREYNQWWVDNVPYIDIPDQNVKKMSYYHTFLNRYNYFDGNIPGNDYQYPVSIEGVLGYNNAIQLTQPMHMQDLKYFRDPIYSYGNWVSSGETSKCHAFTDNPGGNSWGNTYEQYIAREAWNAYKVHGGDPGIIRNFAYYAECDVKGQLDKYDTNGNYLIEYVRGYLTGNDADATPFYWASGSQGSAANRQDRAEAAFQYAGAKAAAEAYALLGEDAKAAEMNELAENIKNNILTLLWDDSPVEGVARPGHVFKHRLVSTGELIPWKDQQNFVPFIEGIPPTDDLKYREALRYFADKAEFPIMPFYTANQRDKAEAAAMGRGGSNNFSNINSTLQAQTFIRAITEYPSEYITPDMFRLLLEWLTWVNYIGGDNRYPDNNEYFYNWNATSQTLGRSGIHHNILGAFNFMIIDGIAGVRPRLDDVLELWPIDVGWDYFTINNLSYHGQDLTLVWDRPGTGQHYGEGVPQGFSAYLNGQQVFVVDDLVHVSWDAKSGVVTVLDGSDTNVLFSIASPLPQATEISLIDNARIVDMFQKAGRDLTLETGWAVNLAQGKPVSASYTTTSPATRATAPENAVSGFTVSGLPAFSGGNNYSRPNFVAPNTIWGTEGSPNAQDWFEVDLGTPTSFDTVKLYFFNDHNYSTQQNCTSASCGNRYREPLRYTVQYHNGTEWVRVPEQHKSDLLANYNQVQFNAVSAQRMRVLMTPAPGYGIGLKEIQVFYTGVELPPMVNQPPAVNVSLDSAFSFPLKAALMGMVTDDELIFEFPEVTWSLKQGPGLVSFADANKLNTIATFSAPGTYILTLSAYDGEFTTPADLTVEVDPLPDDINLAFLATPSTSYVSSWENLYAINDGYEPSNSRDKGPGAYGNWNASGPTQWVQYTWPEEVVVDRSDVYWWTDGGGIQMPTASSLDYWNGSDWVPVSNGVGFGVLPDRYNTTTFDPVKTDRVRMTITRGTQWTGILEWKVFQAPVQSVEPVEVTTLNGHLPMLPPKVTAVFQNNITLEKNVIWDEITYDQVQNSGTSFVISGAVDISHVSAEATIHVESALLSSNLPLQSVQYSDAIQPVSITATDDAADLPFHSVSTQWSLDGGDFQPGLPSGLTLTAGACSVEGELGNCTWTLEGQAWVWAGTYVVRTSVSDGRGSSETDVAILVTPEDAYLEYTGEAIKEINKELALRATVWDSAAGGYPGANPETGPGATIGDLTQMWIAFDIYSMNDCLSGSPLATQYAQVADTGDAGDGIGTASSTFTSGTEDSYCVSIRLVGGPGDGVNEWYTADNAEAVLTFYEASGQFATGGGWIKDPDGGKGNLGFTARYLKNGRVRGNMVYLFRGVYQGELVDFKIKSTALNALAFDGTEFPISAILQGKCTIQINRVSDGFELYSEGNGTFRATVIDSGDIPDSWDMFSLVVYDKNGVVYKSVPSSPLEGGNIIAHK